MEMEDEIFQEDDIEVIDIIDFGFPRRLYIRPNYIQDMDDLGFFRRFRLTKPTVLYLLELIEGELEFENDLNNSVSPINQLLTMLMFCASSCHQINIGDCMHMDQSTVSRVIVKVSEAIATVRNRFVKMPSSQQEMLTSQRNFYHTFRFPRVIGCVDGTHIKIRSPGGEDGEIYRNRKSVFSINVQLVCDSELKILNIVARWPGSAHDATIFNNSRLRTRFEAGEFGNGILLGDSAYPLKSYLLTPLGNPITRAENLYNEAHIRTRNCIERTNGVYKRRFPVLCYGLRCKLNNALTIIVATAVLHNIALTMNEDIPPPPAGINAEELDFLIDQGQIPNVPLHQNVVFDFRREVVNNHFANL